MNKLQKNNTDTLLSPEKVITKTSETKQKKDNTFQKATIELHPSMVPFLPALEFLDDHTTLLPFIAPVNHNEVNESKMVQIFHSLMGDFCHGDKNKESQPEDMGNDACIMVAHHAKVSSCYLQQDILSWNYWFHFLAKYFISILHYSVESNCQ